MDPKQPKLTGVVFNQPTEHCATQDPRNSQRHPKSVLNVLQNNRIYKLRHEIIDNCCLSSWSYSVLSSGFHEIMTGTKNRGQILFHDLVGEPVMEINGADLDCIRSTGEVKIEAPPGHAAGIIDRGYLHNHFNVRDAKSGRVFVCEEKWDSLGIGSFVIKDAVTHDEVAVIDQKGENHCLAISDPAVTPVQKALFLGLTILKDILHVNNQKEEKVLQQRQRALEERDDLQRHKERQHHHWSTYSTYFR